MLNRIWSMGPEGMGSECRQVRRGPTLMRQGSGPIAEIASEDVTRVKNLLPDYKTGL